MRGIEQIQVVTRRDDDVRTRVQRGISCRTAAPCLNNHVGRQLRAQHFIPTDASLAMPRKNLSNSGGEIALQLARLRDPSFTHECFDVRHALPRSRMHFVTTDVHEFVRKQRRNFRKQCVEKHIGFLARRIQTAAADTELLAQLPVLRQCLGQRREQGRELRIAHQPTLAMARHIQLGNHANATFIRVAHQVTNIILGIELTVTSSASQARQRNALQAKTLIVAEVQVQHVELQGRHTIQHAQQIANRQEMARRVEHHAAIGKARGVVDSAFRNLASVDELQQRFNSPMQTQYMRRHQTGMCSSDVQRITLVTSSHRIALARSRRELTFRPRCRSALQSAIRISGVENNLNSARERLRIGVRHRNASARILKHQRPAQCTPPTRNQSAQQRARHLTTHQQAHRTAQFLRRAKRAARGRREQRYGRTQHRHEALVDGWGADASLPTPESHDRRAPCVEHSRAP